jgi:CheY-specific phosphatase CheX
MAKYSASDFENKSIKPEKGKYSATDFEGGNILQAVATKIRTAGEIRKGNKKDTLLEKQMHTPKTTFPGIDDVAQAKAEKFGVKQASPILKMPSGLEPSVNNFMNVFQAKQSGAKPVDIRDVVKPLSEETLKSPMSQFAAGAYEGSNIARTATALQKLSGQKEPLIAKLARDTQPHQTGWRTAGKVYSGVLENAAMYGTVGKAAEGANFLQGIKNPFLRNMAGQQLADTVVQTPGVIVQGIADKKSAGEIAKDVGIQQGQDLAGNLIMSGAEALVKAIFKKLKAGKALAQADVDAVQKATKEIGGDATASVDDQLKKLDDYFQQKRTDPLGGKLPKAEPKPIGGELPKAGQKSTPLDGKSKFAQTVANSDKTTPELSDTLKKLDLGYGKAINVQSLAQANKRISDDVEDAVRFVLESNEPSAEHTTTAIQLINRFQNEGNFERAVDVAIDISSKLTKDGQAIQAANIYDRLSPEGILLYAQRQVNKLNDSRWFKGLTKEQKINPELAKQLKELAENMKNLTGDAKIEASQELQQVLQSLGKSSVLRKIESAQTIAQLLNPKTIVTRNPLANEIFYRTERINKYLATPIDIARSKLTGGDRQITFKKGGQGGYWEGFFKGAKAGWKGVNPGGLTTQFDLTAPAFKVGFNRAKKASNVITKTLGGAVDVAESTMAYLEKTLGATLKGFDYAAYNRAYKQTIGEMAELKAINLGLSGSARKAAVQEFIQNADRNILDIADQYGKYVTFQDNNVLSKGLSSVKRGLNLGKEWGVGSLVVKYPKTPGALIMRGLDYSPAGFLKSAYELAKPLLKGGKIDTREATMALSRAITGTLGFTGMGYYLADKGVITGRTDRDQDVRELQKQTGAGSYKVNLSALQRWAMNGFNEADLQMQQGDTLYTYDWAQPIAMAISFGANINANIKENEGVLDNTGATIASSLEGALGTIAEQPVLQGITRQFQGYDLGQNVTQTLKGIPSSFTPTFANQVRQYQDNTGRSTYNPDPLKSSLNMAQVKIPGKSSLLPANYDTLGKQKENYQNGSNNFFNVFLNPGFVSQNNPTSVQKEILRLYETTGDKKQFPRVVDSKLTWTVKGNSNSYTLSQEEKPQYQKSVGEKARIGIEELINSDKYKNAKSDDDRVKMIYNILNDASAEAKEEFLKQKGLK